MSYTVGERIDLSHIGKPQAAEVSRAATKSSGTVWEVGTELLFRLVEGRYTIARRIPVFAA